MLKLFKSPWCAALCLIFMLPSCKKFLEADLDKSLIVNEDIFSSDVTATAAVTAIYNTMSSSTSIFIGKDRGLGTLTSLSTGELHNYQEETDFLQFEIHHLIETNALVERLWNDMYNLIYQSNAVIEGIQKADALTPATAKRLEGEARFVRALVHFYLTNLFGEVPLVTTTDYRKNRLIPRTSVETINKKIEEDLLAAQSLLKDEYVTSDRARPNKATASTLLARFYLYQKDYTNAALQATSVISNGSYTLGTDLTQTFLINSEETIWQIFPTEPYFNTFEGFYFIITETPRYHVMTPTLLNSFEIGDHRAANWVGSYYDASLDTTFYFPYKYKIQSRLPEDPVAECSVVFRLPELYLIRAEAEARLGNVSGAQSDLNEIRNRVGLGDTDAADQATLLLAIEHERSAEFFTEYGHRWMDLKRTGRAINVLGGGIVNKDLLYPVPRNEFSKNPSLGKQNPGY